jgi:hypothetical protein
VDATGNVVDNSLPQLSPAGLAVLRGMNADFDAFKKERSSDSAIHPESCYNLWGFWGGYAAAAGACIGAAAACGAITVATIGVGAGTCAIAATVCGGTLLWAGTTDPGCC